MTHKTVGIVGSGIAGLLCAQGLRAAGHPVFLVDKGRRAGGRMATRRVQGWQWDHGAQYFTVRNARFRTWLEQWEAMGIIDSWFDRFPLPDSSASSLRYIGRGGMQRIPQALTEGLTVHQSTRIDRLERLNQTWHLWTESDAHFECDELVLTPPLPQVLDLLRDSDCLDLIENRSLLESVVYEPSLACLLVLDKPSLVPPPGCLSLRDGIISWIADHDQKWGRKAGEAGSPCLTVHATPEFTKRAWAEEDALVIQEIVAAASQWLGSEVTDWQCHRWKYALAKNPLSMPYYRNAKHCLSIAGDAFQSSRIESAALSGIRVSDAILKS
ncbi:MAG: NAD(P)/FAD-dependent oxidoreductase [Opitutales bacterium]